MLAKSEAWAHLEEAVGLTVGDIGQQTTDEVEAVVAFAFVGLPTRALDELAHDVGIG